MLLWGVSLVRMDTRAPGAEFTHHPAQALTTSKSTSHSHVGPFSKFRIQCADPRLSPKFWYWPLGTFSTCTVPNRGRYPEKFGTVPTYSCFTYRYIWYPRTYVTLAKLFRLPTRWSRCLTWRLFRPSQQKTKRQTLTGNISWIFVLQDLRYT